MNAQTHVPGTCTIENCGKPHYGHGWCSAHYQRWRNHGDPLAGARTPAAKGEPERFFLEVVMAYEGDDCLAWPYGKTPKGYGRLKIDGRQTVVSRLVCERVNGPPPTPDHNAAHSCGNGHLACVTKGHLSWKTPSGNQMDRVTHGTSNRGAAHPMAKLTEAEIVKTRSLYRKIPTKELAAMVGVSTRHVGKIGRVQAWSWLEEE